jgi:hypothetical protein
MVDTFRFNSRDEVVNFDGMLKEYSKNRAQLSLPYCSLVTVYDKSQSMSNGLKIFWSYFDILISITLLLCDSHDVGATWNDKFSRGKLEGGTILDSKEKFFGKMDIHRYNISFILQYRALWDKIMGFLILVFSPEDYDTFTRADSRKKSFKKIAQKHSNECPYLLKIIEIIDGPLTEFNDEFRTLEAHFTGRLRKWSFLMQPLEESPAIQLHGHWNQINQLLQSLEPLCSWKDEMERHDTQDLEMKAGLKGGRWAELIHKRPKDGET